MDSPADPGLPPILPPGNPSPVTGASSGSGWRKFLWILLVLLLAAPLAALLGWIAVGIAYEIFGAFFSREMADQLIWLVPFVMALGVTVSLARLGLRRGWHRSRVLLWGWGLLALEALTLGTLVIPGLLKINHHGAEGSVIGNLRQLSACSDQFALENPQRVFMSHDDLIGSDRYMKALTPAAGESYESLFPIRVGDSFSVTMPWGKVVTYDNSDSRPAPPRDGVQVERLPDGRRFETTWKDGQRDGPFRAYQADNSLLSEATYVHGQIAGPCWLYLNNGAKVDENPPHSGRPIDLGQQKLKDHDYAGAEAAFNRALAMGGDDPADVHRFRGEARRGLGDFDGAIADYKAAAGDAPVRTFGAGNQALRELLALRAAQKQAKGDLDGAIADCTAAVHYVGDPRRRGPEEKQLQELLQQRAAQKQAKGDRQGAAADRKAAPAAYLPVLFRNAANKFAQHDYAGAIADYTSALELKPDYQYYAGRAAAQRALDNLDGAIADYTSALQLAPKIWSSRFNRGELRRRKNDLAGAAEDFRATVDTCVKDYPDAANRAARWLFFTECERGQSKTAMTELAGTLEKLQQNPKRAGSWDDQLLSLLLGRTSETQLLAGLSSVAVRDQAGRRFLAFFSVAMLHQLGGDRAGALEHFRQALAIPDGKHFELEFAEASRVVAAARSSHQ